MSEWTVRLGRGRKLVLRRGQWLLLTKEAQRELTDREAHLVRIEYFERHGRSPKASRE
jgi:hypothetical protein